MRCFKCFEDFSGTDLLISHLNVVHDLRGTEKLTCTNCYKLFGNLNKFQKHIEICTFGGSQEEREHSYMSIIAPQINRELENFKKVIKENALLLALKLCAKPNFPRNVAFEIIADIALYIKKITGGNCKVFCIH